MPFQLHPQLAGDCHTLGRFDTTHVLLHRNALFHWFIVVPETSLADFLDLDPAFRSRLLVSCAHLSQLLKQHFHYPKVNFAAIGNVVPQLHLHLIGRSPHDPLWPAPVWGNLHASAQYSPAQIQELRSLLDQLPGFTPAP